MSRRSKTGVDARRAVVRRVTSIRREVAPSHGVLRSPADPLSISTHAFTESRFHHDFSRVRLHADGRAAFTADDAAAPRSAPDFELDPSLFIKRLDAPAVRETEKCEEFPGGSTDCEVDPKTGTPTGK